MSTRIYVSGKIAKAYKKLQLNKLPTKAQQQDHTSSWNADYLNIQGKKCWLVSHTATRYKLVIPNVTAAMVQDFSPEFVKSLHDTIRPNIFIERHIFEAFAGEVEFFPTNGDRSNISSLSQGMQDLKYYDFSDVPFGDIDFNRLGMHLSELLTMPVNGKSTYIKPLELIVPMILEHGHAG